MSKALVFWLVYLIWVLLSLWGWDRRTVGGGLILFILVFLLGWATFGFVIQ